MVGRERWWAGVVSLVLTGMLVGGCGIDGRDGSDDSGSSAETSDAGVPAPDATTGGSTSGDGIDVDTVATVAPDVAADDRDIVYTASLSIAVDDVRAAAEQTRSIATLAGGRLHDEQSRGSADSASSTLVLKVPPDRFDAVLDDLSAIGDEQSRTVKADDVTAEVVDLEARIKSATASVERTRALLGEATKVADIVVVEGELATRETALEQLLGQQRVLAASVALATITVELAERDDVIAAEADGLPGPLDALKAGGESVVAVGSVVLLGLAVALPWLPIAALVLGILWYVRRRRAPVATP